MWGARRSVPDVRADLVTEISNLGVFGRELDPGALRDEELCLELTEIAPHEFGPDLRSEMWGI